MGKSNSPYTWGAPALTEKGIENKPLKQFSGYW